MRTITQRQLRNDSAAILRQVQAGRRLTVTRNGKPVAELLPVAARRLVPRTVIEAAALSAPRIDAKRFRADLDALVAQDVPPNVETPHD
jgi:prevent-host-death family protein